MGLWSSGESRSRRFEDEKWTNGKGRGRQNDPLSIASKFHQNQMAALEALVSELKVMIHLGPHLNVVNLPACLHLKRQCIPTISSNSYLLIILNI